MACLTQLQIDNLFKHVGSYFKKLKESNEYAHLEHFKYLYNTGINKGVKPETALSYVQVLPGLVNKYLTITNTKVSRDEALKLTSLSYDFEEFTLDKIGEYIGQVKQPDIIETQEETPIKESFEANESLPLFTALTDQILSTSLMETKQFVTEAGQLEKDPIKEWHHNFARAILDRGISTTSGAFDVTLNGHKGFRLKAVKMSSIPFDELFEELKQGKSEEEVRTTLDSLKAVALVITDNNGNILRFDDNYTKSPNGKMVYFNLRPTNSEKINTENSRGRIQSIKDLAKNYKITEDEAKQLVDSEVNKLRNIQNSVFKGTDVLLDINGGTKGYVPSTLRPTTNDWYGFAKENGISLGDIFDSFGMIPLDVVTEGKNAGRTFIYLNNGTLPILLLNRNITDGEALDYAKTVDKFLKDNNYSSGAVTTAANFLSQYIALNSNDLNFLQSYLGNTTNTVEAIANMIAKKPGQIKNRFLAYQGSQDIYYGIKDGDIKQITADEYLNSWRDVYQTLLVKSANGKAEQFNSSLSFMPTRESEAIVNGTKEYKDVSTEKKNTSIVFGSGNNLTNLEDFLKEKNITSQASKKQIQDAYDWYNNSPLKKTIPFTILFEVINSNAKAVFGREGIKLYFGSNYTDLYHEAWHGFSQLFLTKQQKIQLYEEVKKMSGSFVLPTGVRVNFKDASNKQIEELLAEDFRQYKLSNGTKVLGQRPVRNKIFRAILNFLNWLFDGVSFNQARTDLNSIKRVHDLFTKLDTGKIQEYKPAANNALFTSLASPIGISSDAPLNETQSVEVSESMDSVISDLMFQFAKQAGVSIFGNFLGSKEGIKNVYSKIKEELDARLEQLEEDVEGNAEQIYILRAALNNYGDIDTIIDSGNIEGDSTIQYHLRRSKILDWKSKEFDDENKEDSPDFRTLKEKADDGELSFEELANEKVLFLIRTLKAYELKDGKYVPIKNSLGFSKLTNYRKTLGSVINTVSNNTGAFSIYNKLNEVKNKPEIQELLMKLGEISPNEDIKDKNTFNSWVLFANTFNTTKLPMLITIVETFEDGEAQIYNIDASSDVVTIRNKMINDFRTNTFNDAYATVNIKENEMVLDIDKLKNKFQGNIRSDKDGFQFFQAIGMPLDSKLFDDYFQRDETLKREIIKNANYVLQELSDLVDRNPTKYRGGLIPNHFDKLINGTDTDKEFKTQSSVINKLLQLHIKITDVISSFNLKNAEGNAEYENTLNSQISITQNNINESQTQQDLYNKPGFEHLNPANNPMIKASLTFGRLFKNGLRVADLNIRKFSGIQEKKDGAFIQGQSTLATDPVTKFYLEFYSYLTSGFTSNPTPSDKKTYLGFYVEDSTGENRFIAPNMFSDGTTLGDVRLQEIMVGYLLAEHERVWDLNNTENSDINRLGYFSNYGKDFMIFDKILTPETKEALKAVSPTDILSEANSELLAIARSEITEYINKLTDQNYEVFQKINFISDDVLKRATRSKGKINTTAQSKNLVKAFTANTFIQYVESTILFYGDIAAYNLLKEDFHKRDSASGSTGRTMITDPQFIRAYNKFYGSEYAKSLGFSYAFDEDGFANTAIFGDHKYENKALMKEYEDSWRKVYTEELKAQKRFTEKEIKDKVDNLIEKQLTPFTKDEVKEGDAQGWVTMDAYRFFSIMMNEWSLAHEDLYQKIVNGESVDQEKVLKVFSPKKFQYYGPISTSKYHVNALHKFSLLPLIPNVIQGTNLDILHKRMMRDNIQYATFESGSKIASLRDSNNELDKFYSDSDTRVPSNDTLTPNRIHLRYLRNQVPINDYYKERVVFSTQLRALIYNDLFNKGIPLNKKISDLVDAYIDSIDKYVEAAKDELKEEIDFNNSNGTYNVQKLAKIIKKELDRRDIPQHLQIAATSVSDDNFTFDMSLARNAEDIEKILFSIANKRIVRRKFNGEPLIQAAGTGFENQRATNPTKEQLEEYKADSLLFYRTDPETGERLPIQVKIALQGKFKNLLGLEFNGQKIGTREILNQAIKNKEWRDKHKEMLQLVGVRIPVQGHNAMEYMEVAEFLPEIAGPIIVLPSYIVAKAGSDYDIDKLSIFFPNISGKTIYNLNNKNIKSITENSALNEAFSKSKLSKKDTVRFIADVLTNKQKNYKLTAEDKLIAEEIIKFKEIIDVKLSEDKLEKLENDIIRNMIKVLSTPEVFEMMKKPNGTYLVQDFADNVMTKYFETDYNPKKSFDDWDRSTVSKINSKFKVSPTNIFELLYNIYKQSTNSGAKSALGIGANVNKIKALFNQVDFQMQKEYDHTRWDAKKRKTQTQTRAIRILLNHIQTKNGNISLGSLYNVDGTKISDYLNQLMNGWLDVAKDPWIFYVMGTPELTPALLYLVSAGTPFEEAVYFLAQPAVRNYIEDVKRIESPISRLDKSFNYEYEFQVKAAKLGLQKGGNGHDLWNRQMGLINMEMQRTNGQLFSKEFLINNLDSTLDGTFEFETKDQAILAHFFEINDAAKAIARVQQSFNFDTKTSSTLFDSFKRAQKRDILLEDVDFDVNFAKMFPKDKLTALYEDTILKTFDISDLQKSLFGNLFAIRNNRELLEYLYDIFKNEIFFGSDFDVRIKQNLGSLEKFVSEFQNDFTAAMMLKMLYDFKIEDNKYKGLEIIKVNRDVDIRDLDVKKDVPGLFDSNPELANEVYDALGFNNLLPSKLPYKVGKIYNTQQKEIFAGIVNGEVYINKELINKYSNKEILENQAPQLNTILKNLGVYDKLVALPKEQFIKFLVAHEQAHLDFEKEGKTFKTEAIEEAYVNAKALVEIGILKLKTFDLSNTNEAAERLEKYFPTKEEYIDAITELVAKEMDNTTVSLSTTTGYKVNVFEGSLWGKKLKTSSMDNFYFLQGKDGYPKNKEELKEVISKDIARNIPQSIKEKYWTEILESLPDDEKALLSNWAYYNDYKRYTRQYGKPTFEFNEMPYPDLHKKGEKKYTKWTSFINGLFTSFDGASRDLWFANPLLSDTEDSIINWYKNLTPEKLDAYLSNLSRAMAFKSMVVASFEGGSNISTLDSGARKVEDLQKAYYEIKQRTEISSTQIELQNEQITPQQKQKAEELYSQYIEQTGKQDIEGFKKFVTQPSTSVNPLVEAGIKPTDMSGNAAKDIQMASESTQFIGFGTIMKEGVVSSTDKYAKAWGNRANTGEYTADDVIMVSGSGNFGRGGVDKTEEAAAIKKTLSEKYKPLLLKAIEAGASFRIGNQYAKGNLSDETVAKFLEVKGYTEQKLNGYSRWTAPVSSKGKKAIPKGTKDPKFVASGVFIKDDKIYVDLNRLNNIYASLEDNIDTTKDIGGVSIKYPPKKAFRSFTEFVNYSLEKENLRYVLGKQEAKEIAIRMAANVGNRKRKFDDKKFKLKREYNASDEKNISQLLQTGGLEVTNQYGLLDLIDTSTGEVILSNYKRARGNYIKEYEVEPFNIISDAVETYLMDRALKNINNLYSYTQHSGLDYPTQLLDIINQYPELTTNYLLPSLFSPRKIKNSRNIQLVINQTDLDPTMISLLHEQYKELADETKVKVADKEANKYISNLFQQLSTYSLLTEGFSKQKTSNLSEIIGQEDLLEIGSFNNINRYVSDKLSKQLDFNGQRKSTNFLNAFAKKFFRNRLGLSLDNNGDWQYSRSGISNTKEYLIEDYVAKPTIPENIDNVKYLKKFSDNYYIVNVNGIVADAPSSPDKSFKSKTLLEYADMFSDVTFIFDKATMKTLGLTNLKADNIKVVSSPEALASLNIEGPIALPSNGLDKTFNTVITEKFGILNLQKGIMDNASLTDIINSDSLLVTTDIVNLIRAKAQSVLDELNNSCNI